MSKFVYFDYAATSPVCQPAIDAISEALTLTWGNPSSTHASGRGAKRLLEEARRTFASDLNVTPAEIVFTSGATESISLALHSACHEGVEHIITVASEHKAVLDITEDLSRIHSIPRSVLGVDSNGHISLTDLRTLLKTVNGKALIAVMYVNNETGVEHPIPEIGRMAKEFDALFFCDCVQAGLYHSVAPAQIGIDYLCLSAHKLYGPKGVGLLYISKNREKHPLWKGGSQERGFRSGTENIPSIAGFAAAWREAQTQQTKFLMHVEALSNALIDKITLRIPGTVRNGSNTSPHIVHLSIPSQKSTASILLQLDMAGIALSAGSACQSGSHKRSHVVEAMNLPNGRINLRISIGRRNAHDDILYLIEILERIL